MTQHTDPEVPTALKSARVGESGDDAGLPGTRTGREITTEEAMITTDLSRGDILTGRTVECVYCYRTIYEVQDPTSFVIDWGSDTGYSDLPLNVRLDYGCDSHPLSNEEGTYGHAPTYGARRGSAARGGTS